MTTAAAPVEVVCRGMAHLLLVHGLLTVHGFAQRPGLSD